MEKTNAESPFVPGLISIVSPCWNSETFVHRLLDSVLNQDYPNVEMIVVNDGSTDGTAGVLAGYEEKFRSRGYVLKNLYQENAGQAAALDVGLKKFSGEFLIWTDSDDYFLVKNALSTFVDFLRKNPDIGFACCNSAIEKATGEIGRCAPFVEKEKTPASIFERLLMRKIFFIPGRIMVRTETFLKAIPTRSIFHSRQGQNFQMEFPIAYASKCGFIADELYCYVERSESHSHSTPMDLNRIDGIEEIIEETLSRIDMPPEERMRWRRVNKYISARERMNFYFNGYFRELLDMWKSGILHPKDLLHTPYSVFRFLVFKLIRRIVGKKGIRR